jgi:hypothetical protein
MSKTIGTLCSFHNKHRRRIQDGHDHKQERNRHSSVIDNPVVLATPTPSDGDLFCKPNPEIIFAKGEFHMTAESFESDPESDLAYWKCRVANLEIVVGELLVKNERLRRELQMSVYPRSGSDAASLH